MKKNRAKIPLDTMKNRFDVIVVGGGHAGIEAAHAAARMGSDTLLLTLDIDKVASMPCNPSIGGLGKSHIVYEVSALGGLMPKLSTQTYLQARMLNTRKGPAVQGLRLQIDKYEYSKAAKKHLLDTPNLTISHYMTTSIITKGDGETKKIIGVRCSNGSEFFASSVVITTGTFMNGLIHVGRTRYKAGRRGEEAVYGLSNSIADAMGVTLGRLKTGTPPRLLTQSLDYSQFEKQDTHKLDYLFEFDPVNVEDTIPCYITTTTAQTHKIITDNLHLSALYSDNIKGIGPRYCPSIEDKVGRYPDRDSHHVFIEPEGQGVHEIYPAGLSTSLPLEVQIDYIKSIPGFENAEIAKCGYAIEYDFIQPTNLTHWLETKQVKGLFLAGQVNGTTGYEEAAGQGIMAGINASLKAAGKQPFLLNRNESYIGVMLDDLVTLGANEPYRMFTSRAERRLLLRQDNAFLRLLPYGRQLGLISDELYEKFEKERNLIQASIETIKKAGKYSELFKAFHVVDWDQDKQKYARNLLIERLNTPEISSRALLCIHAHIKYDGYLEKEKNEVEKAQKYQTMIIPASLDYTKIAGLNHEIQEKLLLYRPKTIAQAQLIPGMTPAAISVLIFKTKLHEKTLKST